MGQKVNPHGMRVGVIKDWDSRWYARDEKVGDLIVEDYKIRQYLRRPCIPQASRTSRSSATARRSASISTALVRALSSARAARRSSASASPSRR